jgi:hypothetical protein
VRAIVVAALAAGAFTSAGVRADDRPTKAECVETHRLAQEARRSGTLSQARKSSVRCARNPCPIALQMDCMRWIVDVDKRMPTILVVARDSNGKDVSEGRIVVDGTTVATRIDGRPLELDPGEHRIEVTGEGLAPLTQVIVAREEEKEREVVFAYPPRVTKHAEGETLAERPLPWTFWPAAGLSVVALGTFGYFEASGLSIRGDLDACKPNCSQDRMDHATTSFLIADVSLGIGLVAAGVAAFLYLTRSPHPTGR